MKATVLPTCRSNVRCVVANNLKSKIVCVAHRGSAHDFALYGRRIAAVKGSVVFIRLQK